MVLKAMRWLFGRTVDAVPQDVDLPEDVCTLEAMACVLDREREHCDCSGESFSMVSFSMAPSIDRPDQWQRLAEVMRRRLRKCDVMGRVDADRLGIILPATHAMGAHLVAHHVLWQFDRGQDSLRYCVHAYPDQDRSVEKAAS